MSRYYVKHNSQVYKEAFSAAKAESASLPRQKSTFHFFAKLFMYVSLCFPKAGVSNTLFSLPFTAAYLLFGVCAFLSLRHFMSCPIRKYAVFPFLYIIFAFTTTLLVNGNVASPRMISFMIVLLLSPITWFWSLSLERREANDMLTNAVLTVGIFSVIQFFFGLRETMIPGLTIAFGEDYANKQVFRSFGLSKYPSTYQNGSLLAPSILMMLCFSLEMMPPFQNVKMKTKISILIGFVALLLSGSRTCIFSAILMLPFLLHEIIIHRGYTVKQWEKNILLAIVSLLIILFAALYSSGQIKALFDQIYRAYIGFTLTDATASGRTAQWENFITRFFNLSGLDFFRVWLIGFPWSEAPYMEGLPLIFSLYGGITFLIYEVFLAITFSKYRRYIYIRYCLIVLFLTFQIDGTVLYPPTMMNLFILLGMWDHCGFRDKQGN